MREKLKEIREKSPLQIILWIVSILTPAIMFCCGWIIKDSYNLVFGKSIMGLGLGLAGILIYTYINKNDKQCKN